MATWGIGWGHPSGPPAWRCAQQDEADEGYLEVLAQTVFGADHHVFQAAGVEQGENQSAGLVEQAVIVAGDVHQV
jgi:hypothetical protein